MPPKRYFDDEKTAKPGTISQELRAALNLHDDKLPMWIYKMRVLGYPPGWLQQADITNTSLQLYEDSSQAEKQVVNPNAQQAFNPECFIEFPGFNAPVPLGVKDHCEILGMPPMQDFQQLNFVRLSIQPPKPVPYKRLKFSTKTEPDEKNGDADDDDDEVQIIEPSIPEKVKTPKIRSTEKEEGEASDSEDEIIAISSSIGESKSKVHDESQSVLNVSINTEASASSPKNDSVLILSHSSTDLDTPSTSSAPSVPNPEPESNLKDGNSEIENESIKVSDQSETKVTVDGAETSDVKSSENRNESTEGPTSPPKELSIKLIGMGCPLPADMDSKKPPLEKFAVGMGELIYFENLPTSTGVFDKMRNVISMVRKKLSE